ncbi:MAG: TIGR03663 family protein [Verrucomicrobia bacterium]|jgi:uncharacterized protein (TIGR03663 family)|nr:TIGR03663 family protein [Verrucomicrobiota bacterium]MBT7065217.1 TIGR03663 family protein [Verrucomicrobiota bacterium]MBT7700893.1 TIGR03663 family protein [Verrucomicrobiota bacterium]
MRSFIYRSGFALIVLVALFVRVVQLDQRVLHNDEANQIVRAGRLLEGDSYRYDPEEHHGPTLYYLALPLAWLTAGREFAATSEWTYRLLPALCGVGVLLLLLLLWDGIGRGAVLAAAALMAASPAMVYYSRFFIQETLLLLFTVGAITCGWHYCSRRTAPRAIATGVFLGLMHATKETCIIAYACMGAALLIVVAFKVKSGLTLDLKLTCRHALYMALAALGVASILFSSFGVNPAGIWHSFATYLGYVHKGLGENSDHVHPFTFYLRMLIGQRSGGLFWSEWVIMLPGAIGMLLVATSSRLIKQVDRGLGRFLVFYTLLMTLAYSLIPYKTPWCMLSFLHGWIILAGIGITGLFNVSRHPLARIIVLVLLAGGMGFLARQVQRTSFRYGADARNPYAYSHTVSDHLNLVQRINDVTALQAAGRQTPIAVVTNPEDAWPLPWYLRAYPNTGYWNDVASLPAPFAPALIVASLDREAEVATLTGERYISEYWGLRNEVLLALYIRRDLWDRFMESRQP